jgi:hypothetical protein
MVGISHWVVRNVKMILEVSREGREEGGEGEGHDGRLGEASLPQNENR